MPKRRGQNHTIPEKEIPGGFFFRWKKEVSGLYLFRPLDQYREDGGCLPRIVSSWAVRRRGGIDEQVVIVCSMIAHQVRNTRARGHDGASAVEGHPAQWKCFLRTLQTLC